MSGSTSDELITVSAHRIGAVQVVSVAGEVDLLTAPQLRAAIEAAFADAGSSMVVVDLTDVGFLASAGLGALVEAVEQAQQRRQPLRVVVDHNRPVIRPLQISGLSDVLAVYETVEAALAGVPKDL